MRLRKKAAVAYTSASERNCWTQFYYRAADVNPLVRANKKKRCGSLVNLISE